jgi:cytochrome c553
MSKPLFLQLPLVALALLGGAIGNAGMIDKEGMAPWETCAMCHGADGISHVDKFPKLAGQNKAYIVRQVLDFSTGRRDNDNGQMRSVLSELEPGELERVASYFARLPPPEAGVEDLDTPLDSRRYNLGESIFCRGRGGVPTCASCHISGESSTPWLDAQNRQYLRKQIIDFREGVRKNDNGMAMQNAVSELTEEEIEAVTYYLSLTRFERDKTRFSCTSIER